MARLSTLPSHCLQVHTQPYLPSFSLYTRPGDGQTLVPPPHPRLPGFLAV